MKQKIFPGLLLFIGIVLMVAQWVARSNMVFAAALIFSTLVAIITAIYVLAKKRVEPLLLFAYLAAFFGGITYLIIWGADGGWGAYTSGKTGWSSADHPWQAGDGSILSRLLGNLLIALPIIICLIALFVLAKRTFTRQRLQTVLAFLMSVLLVISTVVFILTTNWRTKPSTDRLWDGHDEYLDSVKKTANREDNPNILFIMMDDMGWGDISMHGSLYDTPNIDSIAQNGISLDNYYSSYSVCSPARFAAMTGRYPYRGYADDVVFPTQQTFSPFAGTRLFNLYQLGANADGMLGDEITMAESLQAAGYHTGLFGKWHLGDYGEYLPTNQGFDYFYGSHHVNDMIPFYHVREEAGEYEIVHGMDELYDENGKRDQRQLTKWIHEEITDWITDQVENSDEPFFAFYTSPWPHAPVFVGDEFAGETGMGTYADCVTEFDHYLGELFQTLEDLGELDNTLIVFTSDNGPALEGSAADLRGSKWQTYEGGQKVPFLVRWDNDGGTLGQKGTSRMQAATLVDLYPTFLELAGVTVDGSDSPLPQDRVYDGVSMLPLWQSDTATHTIDNPILYMKSEDIQAIQYSMPVDELRELYPNYNFPVLQNNKNISFKYFDFVPNDNPAFQDLSRKNWLHVLNDDYAENYNRSEVYPEIAKRSSEKITEIQQRLAENRRGIK